jgi:hypothetical protein
VTVLDAPLSSIHCCFDHKTRIENTLLRARCRALRMCSDNKGPERPCLCDLCVRGLVELKNTQEAVVVTCVDRHREE